MKYLPIDDDQNAYWEVTTTDPVAPRGGPKHCPHPAQTHFTMTDLRSDNLQRYSGWCCTACRWITLIAKADDHFGGD